MIIDLMDVTKKLKEAKIQCTNFIMEGLAFQEE